MKIRFSRWLSLFLATCMLLLLIPAAITEEVPAAMQEAPSTMEDASTTEEPTSSATEESDGDISSEAVEPEVGIASEIDLPYPETESRDEEDSVMLLNPDMVEQGLPSETSDLETEDQVFDNNMLEEESVSNGYSKTINGISFPLTGTELEKAQAGTGTGGSQCWGFAAYIYMKLFGIDHLPYTYDNAAFVTPFGSTIPTTADNVKNWILQAGPGAVIRFCSSSSPSWSSDGGSGHSIVIIDADQNGAWLYQSGSESKVFVYDPSESTTYAPYRNDVQYNTWSEIAKMVTSGPASSNGQYIKYILCPPSQRSFGGSTVVGPSKITFSNIAYPDIYIIGTPGGYALSTGTITSTNPLVSLKSEIVSAKGQVVSTYTRSISGTSYVVKNLDTYSSSDNGVHFSWISVPGNYYWDLTAFDNQGYGTTERMKFIAVNADEYEGIPIDAEHFPDEGFRNYITAYEDSIKNGILSASEISSTDSIYLDLGDDDNISSLKGIEYFSALEVLDCSDQQLTELDLSKNTELIELDCRDNQLTKLNLSQNSKLRDLSCANNQLTELDLRQNTELWMLRCENNKLTKVIFGSCTEFEYLECQMNQLTELDVSGCPALEEINCCFNQLKVVNVNNNTELECFWCNDNQLTSLNIANNTKLTSLYCFHNPLSVLDINNNSHLKYLYNLGFWMGEDVTDKPFFKGIVFYSQDKGEDREWIIEQIEEGDGGVCYDGLAVDHTTEIISGAVDIHIVPAAPAPLALKKTIQLKAYDASNNAIPDKNIIWSTGNKAIATVSKGKVKGISVGTTNITASLNGRKATVTIKVFDPSAPTDMTFKQPSTTVAVKKTVDLTKQLQLTPSTAKAKSLSWKSSNTSVATVSKGKVKGIAKGKATITTSYPDIPDATIEVDVFDPNAPTSLVFKVATISVAVKKTLDLSKYLQILPFTVKASKLKWATGDASIATVKAGKIKGVKAGTTTITVGYPGLPNVAIEIIVFDPNAPKSLSFKSETATVAPKKTLDLMKLLAVTPSTVKAKNLNWSSSDTSIATVKTGKVKGVKAGTVTITASSPDGSLKSSIQVTVG